MTNYFVFLFLLAGQFAFGQSTDSISKIMFDYGQSHSSWGKPGVYGSGEIIEFSSISNGDYKITQYIKIIASAGNDGKTFTVDTTNLILNVSGIAVKEKIRYWLTQLNTNKENINSSFIQSQVKVPTRKEIFQVARKYELLWMLKGVDADRRDTRKAIHQIQNFYKLDSFLMSQETCSEYEKILTDKYNGLRIQTISIKDTTEYRCSFYEPLGQPIFRYDKRNFMTEKKVCNLEANTSALNFLPKHSMISKVLSIDNIKELYIKWYLNKIMDE